jgi:hypothetical protein
VLRETHHADTPVRSPLLGAWLLPGAKDRLGVADHSDGSGVWLTVAEEERRRADALHAELLELRQKLP